MSYLLDEEDDESLLLITPTRKRVRIAPEPQLLDYVEPLSEMSDQDRKQGWWQKDEYEATKATAKTKCREFRKRGNKECLIDAYKQACLVADSGADLSSSSARALKPMSVSTPSHQTAVILAPSQIFARTTHAIFVIPRFSAAQSLVDWCSEMESQRGLERWSSKLHGFIRGKNVNEVKHAVLLEQARQFIVNQPNQEEIARVAYEASKRARAFARLLGEADAAAAAGTGKSRRKRTEPTYRCETVLAPPRKSRKQAPDASPISVVDLIHIFDDSDADSDVDGCSTKSPVRPFRR